MEDKQEKLPRRGIRKHERVGEAKALQDDLQSLGFTPSMAKSEIGKKAGFQNARS